jgi:hypothetical protein
MQPFDVGVIGGGKQWELCDGDSSQVHDELGGNVYVQ